jgi:hypothetical protein
MRSWVRGSILMRFMRTLLYLALVAAACTFSLHFAVPPATANQLPGQIGYGINRWLMIFVPSALGAGIAFLATRKRQPPNPLPGWATGVVVAGLLTLLIVAACLSLSGL